MKTINLIAMVLLVALFGSGCANDSTDEPSQIVEIKTVEKSNHSAINEQKFVIVKDAKTWNELWAEHTKNIQPPPGAPVIDFEDTMVLGVFLGSRPNTCYSVTIEEVEQVANRRLLVKYREVKTGSVCGQAITQPLHLVSLKSMALPVEFVALQ